MPWTNNDYPASMKNLTAEVRHKAIEIANALLEEGYQEGRAIAIATAQAEKWAQRRDKPIAKPGASGSTGQAVESSPSENNDPIHIIPNPNQDGWVAKQSDCRIAQGQDRGDVLHKVRQQAKEQQTSFYLHDEDGKIVEEEDYSS